MKAERFNYKGHGVIVLRGLLSGFTGKVKRQSKLGTLTVVLDSEDSKRPAWKKGDEVHLSPADVEIVGP